MYVVLCVCCSAQLTDVAAGIALLLFMLLLLQLLLLPLLLLLASAVWLSLLLLPLLPWLLLRYTVLVTVAAAAAPCCNKSAAVAAAVHPCCSESAAVAAAVTPSTVGVWCRCPRRCHCHWVFGLWRRLRSCRLFSRRGRRRRMLIERPVQMKRFFVPTTYSIITGIHTVAFLYRLARSCDTQPGFMRDIHSSTQYIIRCLCVWVLWMSRMTLISL